MNFITIAGHLGRDPEVRFTSTGKKVTVISVAARSRRGQNEETIWYRVTVWGEEYDKIMPFFKKGSSIVVCGELHNPQLFTNREGKQQISSLEVTAHYIQFSPFGKSGSGAAGGHENQQSNQETASYGTSSGASSGFGTPSGFGSSGFGTPSAFGVSSSLGGPSSSFGGAAAHATPDAYTSGFSNGMTGGMTEDVKGETQNDDEVPF